MAALGEMVTRELKANASRLDGLASKGVAPRRPFQGSEGDAPLRARK